jgi:hypothetical protein
MHYLVEEKRLEFVARTRFFINLGCWSNSTASLAFTEIMVKYSKLVFILLVLSGCASNTVSLKDINEAKDSHDFKTLSNSYQFRLDYLINDKKYSYFTYEIEDKDRYIELLTESGRLLASSEISRDQFYWPEIRECTLFPHHEKLDVVECLSKFNLNVKNNNNPNFLTNLKSVNEEEKKRKNNGAVGTVVFAILLSPILVPAAILSSPILVYDYKSSENQKEKFHLTLSSNKGLENYLSSFDSNFISKSNGKGSAYLESGIMDEPSVAFGYINNEVIWIQLKPSWVCGGGFMFWGLKCTVGWHEDKHW